VMVQHVAGISRTELDGDAGKHICTENDLRDYNERMEVYNARESEKVKHRMERYRNISTEVLNAHLSPLHNASLRAVETVKAALRPSVVKIVKFGLQQVIKPEGMAGLADNMLEDAQKLWRTLDLDVQAVLQHNPEELQKQLSATAIVAMIKNLVPLVNRTSNVIVLQEGNKFMNYTMINITDVLAESQRKLVETSGVVQAMMQDAFKDVDQRLDHTVPGLPRKIRIMPGLHHPLPADTSNSTEMVMYIVDKALPILAGEVFPKLAAPMSVLFSVPVEEPDKTAYILQRVIPYFQLHPLESFEILPPRGDPPNRRCVTCQEQYQEMVTSTENPNSCMAHCTPLVAMCLSGLDSQCIHQLAPCLRCHGNRLAQLDGCLGEDGHSKDIEKIKNVVKVMKGYRVEQDSSGFLENLANVLVS